jgi:surface protein
MEGVNKNYLYKDIKSKPILKQIFDKLSENKFLNLIKCNKKIQEILNIGINDYINYNKKIKIEIIPIYKKEENIFINYDEDKKAYYHIYFNDDYKEINRNYFNKNDNVTKIKIIIDEEIKSFESLFQKCDCIEKINFIRFKRNDINNMKSMFNNCSSLKELNLNNLKTDNVINMQKMFYNCSLLNKLILNKKRNNQKLFNIHIQRDIILF